MYSVCLSVCVCMHIYAYVCLVYNERTIFTWLNTVVVFTLLQKIDAGTI